MIKVNSNINQPISFKMQEEIGDINYVFVDNTSVILNKDEFKKFSEGKRRRSYFKAGGALLGTGATIGILTARFKKTPNSNIKGAIGAISILGGLGALAGGILGGVIDYFSNKKLWVPLTKLKIEQAAARHNSANI